MPQLIIRSGSIKALGFKSFATSTVNGVVIYANQSFCKLLKNNTGDRLKKDVEEFFSLASNAPSLDEAISYSLMPN